MPFNISYSFFDQMRQKAKKLRFLSRAMRTFSSESCDLRVHAGRGQLFRFEAAARELR
jgi:hypothetical protein